MHSPKARKSRKTVLGVILAATAVIALDTDGSIQVRELRLYGVAVKRSPPPD